MKKIYIYLIFLMMISASTFSVNAQQLIFEQKKDNIFELPHNLSVSPVIRIHQGSGIQDNKHFKISGEAQEASENILFQTGFESYPLDEGWLNYDFDAQIDGFSGGRLAWFWTYENEETKENPLVAASSYFYYPGWDPTTGQMPDLVRANDWFISPAVEIPETGSYVVEWDAISTYNDPYNPCPEEYEIRVIENDVLVEVLNSLEIEPNVSLAEAAARFTAASEAIFHVEKENFEWTTRNASLNPYRDKQVRVIFRHISLDMFELHLDNVKMYQENNKSLETRFTSIPEIPYTYTQVPVFLKDALTCIKGTITNVDIKDLNGVKAELSVYDEQENNVLAETINQETLSINDTINFAYTLPEQVWNNIHYYSINVTSENGYEENRTVSSYTNTTFTESTLGWDSGIATGEAGVGGIYATKQIGQIFPMWEEAYLSSVTFLLTSQTTSTSTKAFLYKISNSGIDRIAESENISIQPGIEKEYTAYFTPERIKMEKDTQYAILLEELYGEEIMVGMTHEEMKIPVIFYVPEVADGLIYMDNNYPLYIRANIYPEQGPSGIEKTQADENIRVFADNNRQINIEGISIGNEINVYNVQGQCILTYRARNNKEVLEPQLQEGVYILQTGNSNYKLIVK